MSRVRRKKACSGCGLCQAAGVPPPLPSAVRAPPRCSCGTAPGLHLIQGAGSISASACVSSLAESLVGFDPAGIASLGWWGCHPPFRSIVKRSSLFSFILLISWRRADDSSAGHDASANWLLRTWRFGQWDAGRYTRNGAIFTSTGQNDWHSGSQRQRWAIKTTYPEDLWLSDQLLFNVLSSHLTPAQIESQFCFPHLSLPTAPGKRQLTP